MEKMSHKVPSIYQVLYKMIYKFCASLWSYPLDRSEIGGPWLSSLLLVPTTPVSLASSAASYFDLPMPTRPGLCHVSHSPWLLALGSGDRNKGLRSLGHWLGLNSGIFWVIVTGLISGFLKTWWLWPFSNLSVSSDVSEPPVSWGPGFPYTSQSDKI